ncbi:hypothetical protein FGO68_gene9330 [Halteria grandinella]|uniref:Uncharacterized protein n=1 Tax=Halteria grandinella TaxID=5974 RepID=A0A8J8NLL0_HALGN|nr:hypothetical protein FGO68_gene9330 [Halteria grandinella]
MGHLVTKELQSTLCCRNQDNSQQAPIYLKYKDRIRRNNTLFEGEQQFPSSHMERGKIGATHSCPLSQIRECEPGMEESKVEEWRSPLTQFKASGSYEYYMTQEMRDDLIKRITIQGDDSIEDLLHVNPEEDKQEMSSSSSSEDSQSEKDQSRQDASLEISQINGSTSLTGSSSSSSLFASRPCTTQVIALQDIYDLAMQANDKPQQELDVSCPQISALIRKQVPPMPSQETLKRTSLRYGRVKSDSLTDSTSMQKLLEQELNTLIFTILSTQVPCILFSEGRYLFGTKMVQYQLNPVTQQRMVRLSGGEQITLEERFEELRAAEGKKVRKALMEGQRKGKTSWEVFAGMMVKVGVEMVRIASFKKQFIKVCRMRLIERLQSMQPNGEDSV